MRKIKRERIPHDDKTIPQVAECLDVGNLIETEVDELFVVVCDAVSAFHHHVGLLEAIRPTSDIQIQSSALPHVRADPVASHVILGVKTGGKRDMIEHSFLERYTLPLLQTCHQLADGGWNSVLHPTRHPSPPSPRFDLFLDIRMGDRPLVVEEGRNDHRGHVVALRLR